MGAFTIAFDTTIVGALALPWVLLLLHLFLFEDEDGLLARLQKQNWGNNQGLAAVAGVLLFAMSYTLGSAVSRIAQDFFNDDDLRIPRLLRMAMTEDRIIASVYCDTDHNLLSAAGNPLLAAKIDRFQCLKSNCSKPDQPGAPSNASRGSAESNVSPLGPAEGLCQRIMSGSGRYLYDENRGKESQLIKAARDIFGLQENWLLLKGEDDTLRLRQLHDQIMVLRGTTFNGLLALTFCLFAWGARLRREKPRSVWRWLLALIPAALLFLAADAFYHHVQERSLGEPPYMEFSLFVLGFVGALLLWFPRSLSAGTAKKDWIARWDWVLSLVFAVLLVAGVLGWWSTEVLYAQQVIYSYGSQSIDAQPAPASQK